MEQMDRQVAIDVGKGIGEVMAIDWRNRDGGWIDHIRIRVRIDVLKPLRRVVRLVGSEGSKTISTIRNSTTVQELKQLLVATNPDIVFLCETNMHSNSFSLIHNLCKMDGCLAVSSEGRSGGLSNALERRGRCGCVELFQSPHRFTCSNRES
ncbi:hypothetical protein PVK06_002520 [Gossypium arboreum]|uniref:Uncharacterized protein n=1 Tax=Gossypium arboreum TaxID=29729 RepID=A0ABR0R4W1_GOSAR|nr:hypothetical protein PVK06_002520 [Gossypium arboreum]